MRAMPVKRSRPRVIVIVGPTASGKSALAVALAKRFGGEVVSADSRQVYRGLDIGTGKMTRREMRGVPHHLLDVADPRRARYSAADFVRDAGESLRAIAQKGKVPFVCGGTGFYIDVLLGRKPIPAVPPNLALRRKLEKKSAYSLLAELRRLDPRRAKEIDPENKRRIIRAIEVARALGRVPSERARIPYRVLWIGLAPSPDLLRRKIEKRLRERLRRGMIAEARRLRASGLSLARMRELGLEYRRLAEHLAGEISRANLERKLAADIRRYAKRQMTWWKRNEDILWFEDPRSPKIAREVKRFLAR